MIDNKLAIESLERGREQNTERATDLLFHYFEIVLPPSNPLDKQDTRAELRECVEAIVDAAAFAVRRSYLGYWPASRPGLEKLEQETLP